ncbi:DNA primase [Alphaproteobacteria bacterium]|nr:DNA primase [Alphaproteobacteria bacterium]
MQDAKEEVRSRLAIEDVIGEYVQLKRAGRLWRGLSPFTSEKTPSFFVTPDRNIWHDFSANRGGDIFAFVMEVEGLDFRGALELLARKASVDLSQYSTAGSRDVMSKKKRYLEANTAARKYFMQQMVQSKPAQEYIFKKRALTKDTVMEWGIGYAPFNGGAVAFLRTRGYNDAEIRGAGLMGGRGGDMFRDRMTVPLCDNQGQVVGFTGRIIGPGEPKYINTPATLLYDKGRQVFGFHLAKSAIRTEDCAVLTEGNLDVISSHQTGVKNVVACAGTALTVFHLKALSRLTSNIALCFDGDKAGVAATERAIILAQELELNLSVITLPDDVKDPDELIQQGADKWRAATKVHKPAVQWVIDHYASTVDLQNAEGKKKLTTESLKIITKLRDPVEVEHYLNVLAGLTDTTLAGLKQKMYSTNESTEKKRMLKPVKTEKNTAIRRHNEQVLTERILAIAQGKKSLRSILHNLPNEYLTEPLAKVKYFLLDENSIEIDSDLADKLAELELIATQIDGDERSLILTHLKELELIQAENRRAKLMGEFASADDDDEHRRELLNGAINGLNQTIKLLQSTGNNDEFAGLFAVWDGRKDETVVQ